MTEVASPPSYESVRRELDPASAAPGPGAAHHRPGPRRPDRARPDRRRAGACLRERQASSATSGPRPARRSSGRRC
ncbi:hypothetical protein [Nocardioides convexus]|uniref:hypothetical protein n=1 Tax=Nocardioides convexus TaxID=2712224 RepID=UPI00241828A6|nr:hypothetical protein [Nocardioides convexus]